METSENIKTMVREKYGQIAKQARETNASSCCGAGECSTVDYEVFAEDYSKLKGYAEGADLGLGCGIPTEFAQIKAGDTVIDLGSGAGNDVFVARALVGENGKVIGVDMTEAMIEKARANNDKLGFNNVEFRLGEIEKLPVAQNRADVVVSNCVLNLVPNKERAFEEIFRVLKAGGHFSISDVVVQGKLPADILGAAEMYAGCVAGALQREDYLGLMLRAGFEEVKVVKEKQITLPDDILKKYLNTEQLQAFKASSASIQSITVYGEKPKDACCGTDCCS